MDIVTDLLKTTLTGSVDKFSHSYSTLLESLTSEKDKEIECTTEIDAFDLEIMKLQKQKRKVVKKRNEYQENIVNYVRISRRFLKI
jgi:hypothetical protein